MSSDDSRESEKKRPRCFLRTRGKVNQGLHFALLKINPFSGSVTPRSTAFVPNHWSVVRNRFAFEFKSKIVPINFNLVMLKIKTLNYTSLWFTECTSDTRNHSNNRTGDVIHGFPAFRHFISRRGRFRIRHFTFPRQTRLAQVKCNEFI